MGNKRQTGAEYERKAAKYLKNKGYTILKMNYRVGRGEIDIVAKTGRTLVFVEVKYRSSSGSGFPEEAVDYRKQRQICKVSLYFLNQYRYGTDTPVRYDVISVLGEEIRHIEGAFDYCV